MLSIEEVKNIANNTGIEIIYAEKDICIINPRTIPDHCGVYMITTKSGKRYIGSSVNIYNRIKYHMANRDEQIITVDIYLTEDESDARDLEHWFLYMLRPELNTLKPITLGNTKTVQVSEDIHISIRKKRVDIIERYGVYLTISEMVAVGMRNIIDKMEELFNLNSGEVKMVINGDVKVNGSEDVRVGGETRIVLVEQGDIRT